MLRCSIKTDSGKGKAPWCFAVDGLRVALPAAGLAEGFAGPRPVPECCLHVTAFV
jgi:hypothetical protein